MGSKVCNILKIELISLILKKPTVLSCHFILYFAFKFFVSICLYWVGDCMVHLIPYFKLPVFLYFMTCTFCCYWWWWWYFKQVVRFFQSVVLLIILCYLDSLELYILSQLFFLSLSLFLKNIFSLKSISLFLWKNEDIWYHFFNVPFFLIPQ